MKKIVIVLCFVAIAPITCSEKGWLRNKVDSFAKQLVTRHTYEYHSWEHKRDKALLYVLPTTISQIVLKQQRSNMIRFLKQNEENALNSIKEELNFDEHSWSNITQTIKQESEFNLNAMKNKENLNIKDQRDILPKFWTDALKEECSRYGTNHENLKMEQIIYHRDALGTGSNYRPNIQKNKYNPAAVGLSISYAEQYLKENSLERLLFCAIHEMTHVINNHMLVHLIIRDTIVQEHIMKNLTKKHTALLKEKDNLGFFEAINPFSSAQKKLDENIDKIEQNIEQETIRQRKASETEFLFKWNSKGRKNLVAAQEKIADTLVSCMDPNASALAFISICQDPLRGYPENHNDMKVIYENWRTSQKIAHFQELKNSIMQKLSALPKL